MALGYETSGTTSPWGMRAWKRRITDASLPGTGFSPHDSNLHQAAITCLTGRPDSPSLTVIDGDNDAKGLANCSRRDLACACWGHSGAGAVPAARCWRTGGGAARGAW